MESSRHNETLHFHGAAAWKSRNFDIGETQCSPGDIQGRAGGHIKVKEEERRKWRRPRRRCESRKAGTREGEGIAANKYKRRIVGQPDGELFPSLAPVKIFFTTLSPAREGSRAGSRGY